MNESCGEPVLLYQMKYPIKELLTDELHPVIQLKKIRVKASIAYALMCQGANAWHSSHLSPSPGNQGAKQMKKPPQHKAGPCFKLCSSVLEQWSICSHEQEDMCSPCSSLNDPQTLEQPLEAHTAVRQK